LAEKAAKFAGKKKMKKGPGRAKVPKAKKQKSEKSTGTPEKSDGVIGKMISHYEDLLDKAQEIYAALDTLQKYGVNFELPKRHVVGTEE
jgi:hypothetical protein